MKVCTLCKEPAEFIESEGIWRHEGDPRNEAYRGSAFCDKYGYPIEVEDEVPRVSSVAFPSETLQVQMQFGGSVPLGYVAVIIKNCPISQIGNDTLAPCFKLEARVAMEIGMQFIHMAKLAEQSANSVANADAEPCRFNTQLGPCQLPVGHSGSHVCEGN